MLLRSNKASVWALAATNNAISATVLRVNSFSESCETGTRVFKYSSRSATSHVSVYRGTGGLKLYTPFRNLITHG